VEIYVAGVEGSGKRERCQNRMKFGLPPKKDAFLGVPTLER
jgi:hypothetical protein